jgi:hypothetical protein
MANAQGGTIINKIDDMTMADFRHHAVMQHPQACRKNVIVQRQ